MLYHNKPMRGVKKMIIEQVNSTVALIDGKLFLVYSPDDREHYFEFGEKTSISYASEAEAVKAYESNSIQWDS